MKKIWVIQYNDGISEVYDTPQPAPAYPYVDAFEYQKRMDEIDRQKKRIKQLETTLKTWLISHSNVTINRVFHLNP